MADGSDDVLKEAARSLEEDAGCEPARALALAKAVSLAAATEALEVVAGQTQVFGSAVDRRVGMLERMIRALDADERLPTIYEVGAIFRITPSQARNVLRTYEARFAERYRGRQLRALQAAVDDDRAKHRVKRGDTDLYIFKFPDPGVLEYAVDRLRRRGLARGVSVDWTKLELAVDRSEKDRFNKDAYEVLKRG